MGSTNGKHGWLPKARTDALLTEKVDDETVVYDLDSKNVHCLGPLAAAVFECCDGGTAPAQIATVAQERLGRAVTEDEAANALDQLQERSLLENRPQVLHTGFSRRDLMRKTAEVGAAAAVVPLITSVSAANAATGDSKQPPGGLCGSNKNCASNHCCQDGRDCNAGKCVACDNACNYVGDKKLKKCAPFCDQSSSDVCCRCVITDPAVALNCRKAGGPA